MKRFLRTFTLLIVGLFFVISGVDATLDHLAHSVTQGSLAVYNEQGSIVLAYNGDLSQCKVNSKPGSASFLHRS